MLFNQLAQHFFREEGVIVSPLPWVRPVFEGTFFFGGGEGLLQMKPALNQPFKLQKRNKQERNFRWMR